MLSTSKVSRLSDDSLLRRLTDLTGQDRELTVELLVHIGEVDARELYLGQACSSMFTYCKERLRMEEGVIYNRIHAARLARVYPIIIDMIAAGEIHLSGVRLLGPKLTAENHRELLSSAKHMSKREVEVLIANRFPAPNAPSMLRKLPAPRREPAAANSAAPVAQQVSPLGKTGLEASPLVAAAAPITAAAQVASPSPTIAPRSAQLQAVKRTPDVIAPTAPERFKVQFTADQELHDKLERLQALMRSSVPDGDLGAVIEAAVTEKLERLEARRLGKTKNPRKSLAETDTAPTSRYILAGGRRAVWERDGGRCTYLDAGGRRCNARDRLEFHHHGTPFGRGGDHSPKSVRMMCRARTISCWPRRTLAGRRWRNTAAGVPRERRCRSRRRSTVEGRTPAHHLAPPPAATWRLDAAVPAALPEPGVRLDPGLELRPRFHPDRLRRGGLRLSNGREQSVRSRHVGDEPARARRGPRHREGVGGHGPRDEDHPRPKLRRRHHRHLATDSHGPDSGR